MKKILAWADAANAGTGFGVVSKYVLGALYATGRYDIDQLAINFNGDFVDKNEVPWQMQAAKLLDPNDLHGMKMFYRTLMKKNYDIVWILNDLYVTTELGDVINKAREKAVSEGVKPPVFIYYYPVDCKVPPESTGMLDVVDIAVCYTKHGRLETLKTKPEISNKLLEIPHGVDTQAFYPLTKNEIALAKNRYFGVNPDTFVVMQSNRNSLRKQIPYSLAAFKEFRKQVPNSVMYLHTMINDQGSNLARVMQDLGLHLKKDLIFPANYSPQSPAPIEVLNRLYNTGDLFLSCHLGEGWGLSCGSNTYINTLQGIKYLKDIQVGDSVLTEDGTYQKVLDTTSHPENEIYKVQTKYSEEVITSDKHPYLASKDHGKTLEWLNVKQLKVGDHIAIVKPKDAKTLDTHIDLTQYIDCLFSDTEVWSKMGFSPKANELSISKVEKEFCVSKRVAEDALNKFRGKEIPSRCLPNSDAWKVFQQLVNKYTSEVLEPIKMSRFIPIDETFLEFLGWYLAEGSSENGIRIELSLHKDELPIAQKFQKWCKEVLNIEAVSETFDNKSRLRISNSILTKFLQQECGKGAYNKHVPSWLLKSPKSIGSLIQGLILGDGHIAKEGSISLSTVSPSLAYQFREICTANNILIAIKQFPKKLGNYPIFVCRVLHRKAFGEFTSLKVMAEINTINCINLDNYFLVPILSINKEDNNEDLLYDICVENTHSFMGNGLLLHNTITEAMACGVPVVVPNNSCMPQQVGENSERGYMYECKDTTWIDNSGWRPKGLIPDIVGKMMEVYHAGSKFSNPIVQRAREWTFTHDWNKVTQAWVDLFLKLENGAPEITKVVTQEV